MYSINDICDLFGITKKTVEIYMDPKRGLKYIPFRTKIDGVRFTEEEVCKIWAIKTLVGMGYPHKQIKEIFSKLENGEDYDFCIDIDKRISKLKSEIDEKKQSLAVAETIKTTGRVPIIKDNNIMKINDFLDYVNSHYTFGSNDSKNEFLVNFLQNIGFNKDLSFNENYMNLLESDTFMVMNEIQSFYKTLSHLKEFDVNDYIVQTVAKKFYEYVYDKKDMLDLPNYFDEIIFAEMFNLERFSKKSDLYQENILKYTEEGIIFISKVLNSFALKEFYDKNGLERFKDEN